MNLIPSNVSLQGMGRAKGRGDLIAKLPVYLKNRFVPTAGQYF
jgi:hypothetical protein